MRGSSSGGSPAHHTTSSDRDQPAAEISLLRLQLQREAETVRAFELSALQSEATIADARERLRLSDAARVRLEHRVRELETSRTRLKADTVRSPRCGIPV